LFARVVNSHRWNTVVAFGGFEFVKSEFRLVPEGFDASSHPYLEVGQPEEEKPTAIEIPDLTIAELRVVGRELGVEHYWLKGKETLVQEIRSVYG
jgi:hypothetical protein